MTDSLDDHLDADITFEKIHIQPFRTLILKNVRIIDRNPVRDALDSTKTLTDTFFVAEYITARFTLEGLIRQQGIHLDKATVSNACMNLVLEDKPDSGDGDTSTDNLSRIFRLKKPEVPKRSEKEIFHINDVEIKDMRFTMKNYMSDKVPYHGGINWDDLDVKDINIKARGLQFKAGIMYGHAEHISFREKSGYIVEEMTGSAKVGRGKTIVENLRLKDPWSDLRMPLYMMSYANVLAFSDFISQVKIDGEIADTRLDFKTLTYFAPQLEGNKLRTALSGKVSGYVDNFDIKDIRIASADGGFSGRVNGNMSGIPDMENTRIKARLDKMNVTSEGLGLFLSEWMKDGELDLSKYARGIIFMAEAEAEGLLNSLDIDADISSLIGSLHADVRLDGVLETDRPVGISGIASTKDLDLGRIISSTVIGPVTMRTGMKASMGEKTSVRIDSLFIDRLNFNRYDYSGIKAAGSLSDNMFNGTIIGSDPSLNFILQGGFALSAKTNNARYQFYANVSDADLRAMNIDTRGKSKLRFQTKANFTRTGNGNILGNIDIADLIFENRDSTSHIGNINLTSHSNDNLYKIRLRSQFADGSYTGTAPITRFFKDLSEAALKRETPALFKNQEFEWEGNSYSLDFNSHDSMSLLSFIMPGLYINKDTKVNLNIGPDGTMTASLSSQRIAMGANYIKDVSAAMDNSGENFSGEIAADEIMFAGLSLENNSLKILADDNHVGASFSYDNSGDQDNHGELVVNGDLERENGIFGVSIDILPSTLYLNSKEWNIQPSSLGIKGREVAIESFEVTSGDQRIYAYGSTSMSRSDTLTLSLDRFDISVLNPLLGSDFGIKGAATGNVRLTSPMHSKGLLADMICDSTFIAGTPLGTLDLGSSWNDEFNRFDIHLQNDLNGKRNIDAAAKLTPKTDMLDARISLDSLMISYAEPFLTDVFSEMDGFISGDVMIEGPVDKLEIRSIGTRLDGGRLNVAFTNVPYYADGTFSLDETGAYFDDIRIKDRYSGTGTVEGSINWDRFKDITFDTRIRVNSIEGINLTEDMSEDFYGNVYGTGNISITGPVSSLVMNIDAVTARNGQLHIPMSGATTSGGSTNLLKFKEPAKEIYIDPYEEMRARLARSKDSSSDFLVRLRVEASANTEAFVEIDKASGNVLSGRGNGLIELEVGEDLFNINGDYTLTSGKYNFSALGLVNREFTIQDGSSIIFSGDIMASTLNIDAVYITKTSLAPLLSDDNSVSNRRNVECGIQITERLSNPRLDFSIEIPDLNPMIQSRVESALSTEDKVQKQFLSLLLSNSFLPDEQSGIANNTSMLYSNVTEAMANQLSNILHKLDIPLDLGLNYQPSEKGTDIFDVAVSTQLFNNRVVVNGNIGNKEYSNGGTQNDVVGDLDIEIKLDRSGAFRLNIFSHSADLYSNYLDNSQRNGVGLTYQTEFNTFGQLIRNIFSSKEKRQEAKLAEQRELLEGEKIEFKISKEDKGEKSLKKNGRRQR